MKIKVGTEIESEFGRGPVVAITKKWVIHEVEDGDEVGLYIGNQEFWIPVTEREIGGGQERDLQVED